MNGVIGGQSLSRMSLAKVYPHNTPARISRLSILIKRYIFLEMMFQALSKIWMVFGNQGCF